MSTRNHERGEDQINISVSMPKEFKDLIDGAAKAENRNRSNWIVTKLSEILEDLESQRPTSSNTGEGKKQGK